LVDRPAPVARGDSAKESPGVVIDHDIDASVHSSTRFKKPKGSVGAPDEVWLPKKTRIGV